MTDIIDLRTSLNVARRIVRIMSDSEDITSVDIVNDVITPDSVVEHVIDVDTVVDGYRYDVHITACRFDKVE